MDEKKDPAGEIFSAMANNLLAVQRHYLETWAELAQKTLGETAPVAASSDSSNPWTEALTQWRRGASSAVPPSGLDVYEKLFNAGKSYFALGEQFTAFTQQENPSQALDQWLDQLSRTLGMMGQGFTPPTGPALQDVTASWNIPFDAWQKTAASASPLLDQFLKMPAGDTPEQMAREAYDRVAEVLSIPGLGIGREAQEQYQSLVKLALEYQQVLQEYRQAFAQVGTRTIERFRQHVDEITAKRGPIDSLRALYDILVDVCEAVYGEFIASDDYSLLYGRLNNALMAVKQQGDAIMERALEAMNIPTRRELDTVHERLRAVRRENRELRAELERLSQRLHAAVDKPKPATPSPARARAPATATPARARKSKRR